jgi:hypothetical protein
MNVPVPEALKGLVGGIGSHMKAWGDDVKAAVAKTQAEAKEAVAKANAEAKARIAAREEARMQAAKAMRQRQHAAAWGYTGPGPRPQEAYRAARRNAHRMTKRQRAAMFAKKSLGA